MAENVWEAEDNEMLAIIIETLFGQKIYHPTNFSVKIGGLP